MKIITGIDERTGEQFNSLDSKRTRVDPDPTNNDSTDYPRKGCRQCGRRDRPQYRGVCNDDSCPTLPDPAAELAALRKQNARLRTLARLVTVRQVVQSGDEAIAAAGLNPWCLNEGLATGDERLDLWWAEEPTK